MEIKKEIVDGMPRHFIVGFVIKEDEKYLLFEKNNFPYGYAGSCGHIDEGETVDSALVRELKEETNLEVVEAKLMFEDIISLTPCRYDGTYDHKTYIYEVETAGKLVVDPGEFKSHGWFTPEEIATLSLEPMWKLVFKNLGVI